LESLGNSCFKTTLNSGDFDGIGVAVNADGGSMSTGQLEMSNVDLSQEFTDMITTQRGFQANSRIITVSDTMLEELTNLKR
nr:flagellar hook protein [Lachnospiraceae bacterium]